MRKNLKNLPCCLLVLILFSCNQAPRVENTHLAGNWFFINEQQDSLLLYNEVYLNKHQIYMRNSNTGLLTPATYSLDQNLLFISPADSAAIPFWKIKKTGTDTLWVDLLDQHQQAQRSLEMIRLNKNEKGPLDYSQDAWKKDGGLWQSYEADFQRRYDEFTVNSGRNSWEAIEQARAKADSANGVRIQYEEPEY